AAFCACSCKVLYCSRSICPRCNMRSRSCSSTGLSFSWPKAFSALILRPTSVPTSMTHIQCLTVPLFTRWRVSERPLGSSHFRRSLIMKALTLAAADVQEMKGSYRFGEEEERGHGGGFCLSPAGGYCSNTTRSLRRLPQHSLLMVQHL